MWDRIAAMGPCDPEKFTMQAWQASYYITAWVVGLYLYYISDYWFYMPAMWNDYPQNKGMTALFKLYYLCQVAFWCQMAFVTVIEKWQKDFVQMMMHHAITIGLTSSSYFFGFLRAGHVVLVEQDLADIFLPCAKMFKYFTEAGDKVLTRVAGKVALEAKHSSLEDLRESEAALQSSKKGSTGWKEARGKKTAAIGALVEFAKGTKDKKVLAAGEFREHRLAVHGNICDVLFALFAVAWIPTRHVFFFWILYSTWADCDRIILEEGRSGWDPAQGLFHVPNKTIGVYLSVLGFFQCLLIMWLIDLIKAIKRALGPVKNITEIEDPHEADSDEDDGVDEVLGMAGSKKDQ